MVVKQSSGAKLGTFAGVFTPSILTILGIILFLRLGYVVGNAGLARALLIIGVATAVSALTSISLAAISTNIEVKGGGDYYLISRTLGSEFGGAIGVVLFLAQSVSVAFYAIGFAEVVASFFDLQSPWAVRLVALGAVVVLFFFAWAGADVATRFQFVIMAVLILALASFYFGAVGSFDPALAAEGSGEPANGASFWIVFGIFFPAVTGFTQGVSMSGDLARPGRSLPLGTFFAVGLSTVVYVSAAVLLAGTSPQAELVGDTGQAMESAALVPQLILLGVVAATLSSAMASFLGAPRILQSLASDRIFPILGVFARGSGPSSNPRRAVVLTMVIAIATIGLGSLNVIAPVVSMFFLISYGLLNYATYFETRAKSPYFRPRFKYFNKGLSLIGALLCLGAMLAINTSAALVALVVLYGLYRYVGSREGIARWADSGHAHFFQRAKESISALSEAATHPRNWRPQILAFSGDPERRERLLSFAKWLEGDSGITSVFQIVEGRGLRKRMELTREDEALQDQIRQLGVEVYGRVVLAADGIEAIPIVVQSFGLGPIGSNTVLFGWPETPEAEMRMTFVSVLRDIVRLGVNVVALSSDQVRWRAVLDTKKNARRIDVVWTNDDSGRLSVLAAYLCTRTEFWDKASLRVVTGCPDGIQPDEVAATLSSELDEARIKAEVVVIDSPQVAAVATACVDATMVILPMRLREGEILDWAGDELEAVVKRLPLTAAVIAGAPIQLDAPPDSGPASALAEAEEAVEDARRRAAVLEKQVSEREAEVERLTEAFDDPNAAEMLEAARRRLEEVRRRAVKARLRTETAEAHVHELSHLTD